MGDSSCSSDNVPLDISPQSSWESIPPPDPALELTPSDDVIFVPLSGVYFAFSLNLEATLHAYLRETDGVAAESFRKFPLRTYVGYCVDSEGMPTKTRNWNIISIRPLQQGLPPDDPENRLDKNMCVPIEPETEHPSGRRPISLTKPFPWTNLYHPTCMNVDARVSTALVDYTDATCIASYDDTFYIRECALDDEGQRQNLKGTASVMGRQLPASKGLDEGARSPPSAESAPNLSEIRRVPGSSQHSSRCERIDSESLISVASSSSNRGSPSILDDETASEVEIIKEMLEMLRDPSPDDEESFAPVINVTADYSLVKTLGTAQQLKEDWDALEKIVKACKRKQVAVDETDPRPRIVDWLAATERAKDEHSGLARKIIHRLVYLAKRPFHRLSVRLAMIRS